MSSLSMAVADTMVLARRFPTIRPARIEPRVVGSDHGCAGRTNAGHCRWCSSV